MKACETPAATGISSPGDSFQSVLRQRDFLVLWIVPIFLDFCRLFGLVALDLSASDSVDYLVLPFVGMGVAKSQHVSVYRSLSAYGILLMPPEEIVRPRDKGADQVRGGFFVTLRKEI